MSTNTVTTLASTNEPVHDIAASQPIATSIDAGAPTGASIFGQIFGDKYVSDIVTYSS